MWEDQVPQISFRSLQDVQNDFRDHQIGAILNDLCTQNSHGYRKIVEIALVAAELRPENGVMLSEFVFNVTATCHRYNCFKRNQNDFS